MKILEMFNVAREDGKIPRLFTQTLAALFLIRQQVKIKNLINFPFSLRRDKLSRNAITSVVGKKLRWIKAINIDSKNSALERFTVSVG